MTRWAACALVIAGLVGCGSSTPAARPDGGAGSDASSDGAGAAAGFGTYIVLGDSISDRGGTGPFFYDLLHQNDDTLYPAWQGHDLATRYPGITYVHAAQGGAITDTYSDTQAGTPTLASQITGLGHDYPGDVLVTITIGGNDLRDHEAQAILGTDASIRADYDAHLAAELGELATPGRLGSGSVTLILANIYDATDGQGTWQTLNCNVPVDVPADQDQAVFAAWNAIGATRIAAVGGTLYDLHADFQGHGRENTTDTWFADDCIHPNQAGHAEIRASIWRLITGETVQ